MKSFHFLVALPLLALAACGDSGKHESAKETAEADLASAGPDAPAGLSVSDGVLVLPAVKGNPGVAYFAAANGSPKETKIAAVSVDGVGKAEMHETMGSQMQPLSEVPIAAGQSVRFERGGKHVMLFDLADKLAAGGTAEMTIVFASGDKLSAPLRIEAAGAAH